MKTDRLKTAAISNSSRHPSFETPTYQEPSFDDPTLAKFVRTPEILRLPGRDHSSLRNSLRTLRRQLSGPAHKREILRGLPALQSPLSGCRPNRTGHSSGAAFP